jgi:chromosome segregation ATPase
MAYKLEEKVDKLADVVSKLAGSVDEMRMEVRDSRSESSSMRKNIEEIKGLLNGHGDAIATNGAALTRIERKVDLSNAQLGDVIKKIFEHDDKLEDLDGRVSALEHGVH